MGLLFWRRNQELVNGHFNLTTRLTVTFEEVRDVLQLGDVVLAVLAVLGQQGEVLQVLPAGVARVQLVELPEHHAPGTHLLCSVVHARDGLPAVRGGVTG